MEFTCRSWKIMENFKKFCLVDWLLQMTKQRRCEIERSNQTSRTAHILMDTRVFLLNWLKLKNTLKQE